MSTTSDDQRTDDQHQDDDDQRPRGGNAEAARWRRRVREVEAERDALRADLDAARPPAGDSDGDEQDDAAHPAEAERDAALERVARLQRTEAERLAAEAGLAAPADLWSVGGVELAALLDTDGELDADAVARAVASVLESRPGLRARRPPRPDRGQGSTSRDGGRGRTTSWGEALRMR